MVIKNLIGYMAATLLLPAMVSCTSTEDPAAPAPDSNSPVIGFNPILYTRATKTTFSADDAIKVWAYHRPLSSEAFTDITPVFPNADASNGSIEVTYDGAEWTYSGREYWKYNYIYRFHGLFGLSDSEYSNTSCDDEYNLQIPSFDATQHSDLLYAIDQREVTTSAMPVNFEFKHLLSQVTFVGRINEDLKANDISVVVTAAKLYGMGKTGSWKSSVENPAGEWTLGESDKTNTGEPFASYSNASEEVLTFDGIDLFADENEILIFPLSDLSTAVFEITYHYQGGGVDKTPKTTAYNLGSLQAGARWEAGKKYKYTFTVDLKDYIFFNVPTVADWNDIEVGEIIDREEN